MRSLLLIAVLGACGGTPWGGDDDHDDPDAGTTWTETGECSPPANATPVGTTPADLFQPGCARETFEELRIVVSVAGWDAMFDCPTDVPAGLDFANHHAAVVRVSCSPISYRFAVDTPDQVIVGIHSRVSGACIANMIVVPIPRSTKPVRLARCQDTCSGYCPPVP